MLNHPVAALSGLALSLFAGGAWALAAERAVTRVGQPEAAPAVAVLVGVAITLTLWRRNVTDQLEAQLLRLQCPRCGAHLDSTHEHAGVAHPGGLGEWRCVGCGFAHASALTCAECGR